MGFTPGRNHENSAKNASHDRIRHQALLKSKKDLGDRPLPSR
jgi:hypothetical protein